MIFGLAPFPVHFHKWVHLASSLPTFGQTPSSMLSLGHFLIDASLHKQSWVSILQVALSSSFGACTIWSQQKALIMFRSGFSYAVTSELPTLLHRGAEDGRAGVTCGQELCACPLVHGDKHGTSLQQHAWFYGGGSSAAHLSLPQSSCRKLDAREQTITFFSQEAASCLYRAGSVAFASKIYTNLFFPGACNLSLPHLPSMCLEREVLPHPTSHLSSGCFSASSLLSVLFCGS